MPEYDYLIIGSGIAGLYTALVARQLGSVAIITKGSIDECNTKYAQGGIAAAIGSNDSPSLHLRDTLAAGAGLSDPDAARILTEEAFDRINDLIDFGVPFDTQEGEVALTKEAAHSVPRVLHAGGDATGEKIEISLSRVARLSRITILEHCLATQIVIEGGEAQGMVALDAHMGSYQEFRSRFVILATGGAGRLFRFNTNPDIATGDGIALAYRAGAEIADMEFIQFHPTALRMPGVPVFLISEAVRGEGGILRNKEGHAFMLDYAPDGDLAPRDVVARGIVAEMKRTGAENVFLDVTHLPARVVSTRFPQIYTFCREHGLDMTTSPIPVAPAAHYMMGGVKTNTWGETNVLRLFACGECACTGVHGANRLASNSLLEVLIVGKRIVQKCADSDVGQRALSGQVYSLKERDTSGVKPPPLSLSALQTLMWENVGIVRDREGLEEAAIVLAAWEKSLPTPTDRPSYELSNMVLVGRLMAQAALIREESRGAHYRSDFPEPSQAWLRHIIFRDDE